MTQMSQRMIRYLSHDEPLKRVLVKIMVRPDPSKPRIANHPASSHITDRNRSSLIQVLRAAQESDSRVQFNPMGLLNQIALIGPRWLIEEISRRPDVKDIIPAESESKIEDSYEEG